LDGFIVGDPEEVIRVPPFFRGWWCELKANSIATAPLGRIVEEDVAILLLLCPDRAVNDG
jgi:hypothetical protein